jgi:peptide/nickel transport system permease protein
MLGLIIKRLLLFIPMLFVASLLSFFIIQLPPGDYVETIVSNLRQSAGISWEDAYHLEDQLRDRYALDKPFLVQYYIWMKNIVTEGDFGNSFAYDRPVTDILKDRVPRTMAITLAGVALSWLIAVPIGIYSAVRQYSFFDYVFTFLGFVGLSFPAFLFAIVLVFIVYLNTGWTITGIFSSGFVDAPWSLAKFWDLLKNMTIPMVVLSTAGAAALIRILRATLLDELNKQYVVTARTKGLRESRLLFKYPVRVAINPLISTIGWLLPAAVGGEIVVSLVLNLPTIGPILLSSVMNQDMYLAGAILFILSSLTMLGTLISDILLVALDPRIRYE